MLLNKLAVCWLTFFLMLPAESSYQDSYTTVNANSIKINGILLESSDKILAKLLSKRHTKKVYTPPPGDSDEYDKIHYCEDDNIKIEFYEKNSKHRASSIIIKTEKIIVTIDAIKFQVGHDQSVLEGFEMSYNSLVKNQRDRPSADNKFHLNLRWKNGQEQGIITCFIKQNRIVEIVFSFDPA